MPEIRAKLADGTTLVFEDGTPDDVIDRVVQEHIASTKAPDDRSAGQVAIDQTKNVVRGVGDFATGLVGTAKDLLMSMGNPGRQLELTKKFAGGMAAPFEAAGRLTGQGLGEFFVPGSQPDLNPESKQWEPDARLAGATATAAAAPFVAETLPKVANKVLPEAQTLQQVAGAARDVKSKPLDSQLGNIRTGLRVGMNAGRQVIRHPVAKGLEVAARAKAALEAPGFVPGSANIPDYPEGPVTPQVTEAIDAASQKALRNPSVYRDQYSPNAAMEATMQAAPEPGPYNAPPPEPYRPAPAQMDAQAALAQDAADSLKMSSGFQGPDFAPNAPNTARVPQSPAAEPNAGFNAMEQPVGAPEPVMPVEAEALMKQNADVLDLQNQIRPTGRAAQTWVARNASRLYELMPELRGVPLGERFRVMATNGFKNFEAAMKAAQDSIPPETMLPKADLVESLLPIKADAALANRPGVLRILDKVDDLAPNMRWEDFIKVKEGIRKSPGFGTDPFMRRAYGAFMEAASKVSPELAKANADFATSMRLLEHSKIDPVSGQFLKQPR